MLSEKSNNNNTRKVEGDKTLITQQRESEIFPNRIVLQTKRRNKNLIIHKVIMFINNKSERYRGNCVNN